MPKKLARQLRDLRTKGNLSRARLADQAGIDRGTLAALERGKGTLTSLNAAANALGRYVSPYPSALVNRRKWLGVGTRALATMVRMSRQTIQTFEIEGDARVETYETICNALGVRTVLSPIIETWSTPPDILACVYRAFGTIDLDVASPAPPTTRCKRFYTERDGALWLPWNSEFVFFQPPYEELFEWTHKALEEWNAGRAKKIVALVPNKPREAVWDIVIEAGATRITMAGRLHFSERQARSRWPSAFWLVGASTGEIEALRAALPAERKAEIEWSRGWEKVRDAAE